VNGCTNDQFAPPVQTFAQSTGTPYPMKFLLFGRSITLFGATDGCRKDGRKFLNVHLPLTPPVRR
jgi:hypothetical protein